jgi:hypothetical protein
MHALPRIRHRRSGPGVDAPHDEDLNLSLSFRARVCHPNTRRHVRLLGPCFKTGRLKPLCQHPKQTTDRRAEFLNPNRRIRPKAITHLTKGMSHSNGPCPTIEIDADPSETQEVHQANG